RDPGSEIAVGKDESPLSGRLEVAYGLLLLFLRMSLFLSEDYLAGGDWRGAHHRIAEGRTTFLRASAVESSTDGLFLLVDIGN
ncbi:hypothetical protein U1Q18_007446, partial [Sarracenia purpurea var. burkii]